MEEHNANVAAEWKQAVNRQVNSMGIVSQKICLIDRSKFP